MTANVRCVGNQQWAPGNPPPGRYELPVTPCTWTGIVQLDPDCICGDDVRLTNALAATYNRYGCPRCGGRVELIPQDPR